MSFTTQLACTAGGSTLANILLDQLNNYMLGTRINPQTLAVYSTALNVIVNANLIGILSITGPTISREGILLITVTSSIIGAGIAKHLASNNGNGIKLGQMAVLAVSKILELGSLYRISIAELEPVGHNLRGIA